jgi:hypothetical protein
MPPTRAKQTRLRSISARLSELSGTYGTIMLRQYFSLSRMIDLRKVLSIDRPKMIAALTSDCRLPKLTLQFVDANNARDVFPIVRVGHDPIRMDTQGYMMVQLGPGNRWQRMPPFRFYGQSWRDRFGRPTGARRALKRNGRRSALRFFFVEPNIGLSGRGRMTAFRGRSTP